jgi:hypothetical protein
LWARRETVGPLFISRGKRSRKTEDTEEGTEDTEEGTEDTEEETKRGTAVIFAHLVPKLQLGNATDL